MSEQEHYDAIVALLQAGGANPLNHKQIETQRNAGTLPTGYTRVFLSERYAPPVLVGGWSTLTAWRLQTRAFGATDDAAREVRKRVRAALAEQTITVGGVSATISRPIDDPIDEDGTEFSGLSEFTYTL